MKYPEREPFEQLKPFLVSPQRKGRAHLRRGNTDRSLCGTVGDGYQPAEDVRGVEMCGNCRYQLWRWLETKEGEGG